MAHGQGDEVQEPERMVVGYCVYTSAVDGRPLNHQRMMPSGHVPDEKDVANVHLEEGLNEKCPISLAKHLHKETIAADEGDGYVYVILVAIRREASRERSWNTCVVRHG